MYVDTMCDEWILHFDFDERYFDENVCVCIFSLTQNSFAKENRPMFIIHFHWKWSPQHSAEISIVSNFICFTIHNDVDQLKRLNGFVCLCACECVVNFTNIVKADVNKPFTQQPERLTLLEFRNYFFLNFDCLFKHLVVTAMDSKQVKLKIHVFVFVGIGNWNTKRGTG